MVSILIPCFNAEKFLAKTLESALAQRYPEIEIILVDDGSTDRSLEIARSFQSSKIQVIAQENKGASAARNLAYQQAKGTYIQYLDADDLLHPDKILQQVKRIKNSGENCICTGTYSYFRQTIDELESSWMNAGNRDYDYTLDWLIDSLYDRTMFPPMVWLTPRKLIEAAGPWNEKLGYNDDPEFFARLVLKADKLLFCPDSISYYRIGNPFSLGSQTTRKARISELESLLFRKKVMLEKEDSSRVRKALAFQFSKLNYSLYPDFKELREKIEAELKSLNVPYPKNFGRGLTHQLGKVIGWKLAILIRKKLK